MTISTLCHSGQMPAVKIGRSWMLPVEALTEHLNALAKANVRAPKAGDGGESTQAPASNAESFQAPRVPAPRNRRATLPSLSMN